jgi:hypothetical protein
MNNDVAFRKHVHASSCRTEACAKMWAEVLLQLSFTGSAYLPGIQHGLEFSCSHWFDDWYSLCFACGKEGVFVVFYEVVRNAIGGFECASLFRSWDYDGGVGPFFWVGKGMITCSIGHPPHSSASPVELRLRVGPRTLSPHAQWKKKNLGNRGWRNFSVRPSGTLQRGRSLGWESIGNHKIG